MKTLIGLFAVLMWACLAMLSTYTKAIEPFQMLFCCFFTSFLLMLIYRKATGKALISKPGLTFNQWLIGITGLLGFHYCYFVAIKRAPVEEVSLIVYLWPTLLAILVAGQGSRLIALLGGITGFLGIVVLNYKSGGIAVNPAYLAGYFWAMACALIWSVYSWLLSKQQSELSDLGWLSLVVALGSLMISLWTEQPQWDLATSEWFALLLLGLGPVGGAFYCWEYGMKEGNASLLASLSFLTPVLSVFILIAFGLAAFSTQLFIALLLILAGAVLPQLKRRH